MITRITICGVPCSGAKLINYMLAGTLIGWDYSPEERPKNWEGHREKVITKLTLDLFDFDKLIRSQKTAGIIMVRDPYFVMTAKHQTPQYWVSANRIGKNQPAPIVWFREVLKWKNRGAFVVKYEDLITEPNNVQENITNKWGLEFTGLFSGFESLPISREYEHLGIIRPLSTARTKLTEEDKEWVKEQFARCPDLFFVRKELGYESLSML